MLLIPLYLLSRLSLAEKTETLAQAFHTFPFPFNSLYYIFVLGSLLENFK